MHTEARRRDIRQTRAIRPIPHLAKLAALPQLLTPPPPLRLVGGRHARAASPVHHGEVKHVQPALTLPRLSPGPTASNG